MPRRLAALRLAALCVAAAAPRAGGAQATDSAAAARAAAWREDLDSALTAFLPRDRSFSPAARAAFTARVRALADSAPRLGDEAITVRLAEAVALAGNAHTRLYLLRNRTALRRYPVRLWWFGGELRVVRARPEQAALLGARVLRIAGRPVEEMAARVRPLYAANASWARYMSSYTLTSPEVLVGLGVLRGSGDAPFELRLADGRRTTLTLAPLPLHRTSEPTEAWWDLSPRHPGNDPPWASVLGAAAGADTARLPRYLRAPTRNYWLDYDAPARLLYVQYNRAQNEAGSPFGATVAEFAGRLFDEIARRDPRRVVVDLRFNTGGNLQLGDSLFRRLAALPLAGERGRLFVITGRATFSAGLTPAAFLRERTRAVFVGEPAGEGLDFWAEGGNVVLPRSRLTMHYADGFHSYSTREHPELRPYYYDLAAGPGPTLGLDVPAETGWAAYLAGRDAAMEAVAAYPAAGRAPARAPAR